MNLSRLHTGYRAVASLDRFWISANDKPIAGIMELPPLPPLPPPRPPRPPPPRGMAMLNSCGRVSNLNTESGLVVLSSAGINQSSAICYTPFFLFPSPHPRRSVSSWLLIILRHPKTLFFFAMDQTLDDVSTCFLSLVATPL